MGRMESSHDGIYEGKEDSQKEDRVEIQQRLDSMDVTLTGIMKKLHAMQVSQELRDAMENQLLSAFKEWRHKSDNK